MDDWKCQCTLVGLLASFDISWSLLRSLCRQCSWTEEEGWEKLVSCVLNFPVNVNRRHWRLSLAECYRTDNRGLVTWISHLEDECDSVETSRSWLLDLRGKILKLNEKLLLRCLTRHRNRWNQHRRSPSPGVHKELEPIPSQILHHTWYRSTLLILVAFWWVMSCLLWVMKKSGLYLPCSIVDSSCTAWKEKKPIAPTLSDLLGFGRWGVKHWQRWQQHRRVTKAMGTCNCCTQETMAEGLHMCSLRKKGNGCA